MPDNLTEKESIIEIYRNWTKGYDFIANISVLIGHRINLYRKKAVDSLNLKEGDVVVDLACGTGLNFPYLQMAVGHKGRIVGVDITDAMLEQARRKIEAHGWENVDLIHCDVEEYKFPDNINAVLSTFALGYLPNYDGFIKKIRDALPVNGKFAELSFKAPKGKLAKRILFRALRPFGTTEDYEDRHIWESVEKYFDKTNFREFYFGTTYIATGKKTDSNCDQTF